MILAKVNRVLQFNRLRWLKSCIDKNTELRNVATTDFEKDFFKLMNNSFYGKTIENVRNRVDIHLVNNAITIKGEEKIIRYQSKPNFVRTVEFNENLKAVKLNKKTITFNKPIYVGVAVLELSKLHMYNFYYNVLKKKYGDNVEAVRMDTDSFFLNIKTIDLWQDVKNDSEFNDWFDFSNAPKDHFMFNPNNKKLGKFKNELVTKDIWDEITEIIFIKSKVYSYVSDYKIKMRNKGTSSAIMKTEITHDDYINCLYNNFNNYINYKNGNNYYRTNDLNLYNTYHRIASEKLEIYVYENKKLTMSNQDDKRFISSEDGISTWPIGYFDN